MTYNIISGSDCNGYKSLYVAIDSTKIFIEGASSPSDPSYNQIESDLELATTICRTPDDAINYLRSKKNYEVSNA